MTTLQDDRTSSSQGTDSQDARPQDKGATVWMTGLPSSGKSTIGEALAERLRAEGHRVEILDGDVVRTNLSKGLGFSREDRDINISRIGFVADLLARNGVKVVSAAIAPFANIREQVRHMHTESGAGFVEVYVATPVEVCSVRDVKGLYAKQAKGELKGLTGVDDPYEIPEKPDVTISTQDQTLDESVEQLYTALVEKGFA